MSYELIITEKPNAAKMIAQALSEQKLIKENEKGVPYYKIKHKNKEIIIGCAVGHLYTVAEKNKSFNYPVFDLEWKPNSEVIKNDFSKKYLAALKKLSKEAKEYTVATDYDIEGEVIGLNVIRFVCKQKDASRMKFSTLTKSELIESYEKKSKTIDWGQAYAGETRHFLDWMYGINLSRALTTAIKNSGMFKILSSGRVQGPALKLIVDKEKEIQSFKPEKYWQISVKGKLSETEVEAWHEKEKFEKEKEALEVLKKTDKKNGKVISIKNSEFIQKAPVPFDLTTLQTEAYRIFGIKPKQTLDIAQNLYTSGYISYPRTSSQKLPNINFKKILEQLSKYDKNALDLLKKSSLKPNEGKKTDPAHPAIYPTGIIPSLKERDAKIYDLIVKRFLACFGEDAKRETATITIDISGEKFLIKGTRTKSPGWHNLYKPYVQLEETELPKCKINDIFYNNKTIKHDKETQPPKRYTPASIIKELEKRNLGTKATRAAIIDSLYERNYIKNESIEATELGIQTIETLSKYAPEIIDEKLTRHFEIQMEKIRQGKTTEEKVLKEAEKELRKILEKFKKNEKTIGKELNETYKQHLETENTLGKCPKCNGNLKIMYSRKLKRKFIACDNEECKTILNMPGYNVKATEKVCEHCKYPIVKVLNGKKSRELCINQECPSKKITDKKAIKEIKAIESGKTEINCPKCNAPLVVRKSVYGQFLGCSKFPACRYTEKIPTNDEEKAEVEKRRKYFMNNKQN
ncbi:MAG: DNA topoisomerase I [Candidatus Woesearchaeota archaeon]